MSRRTPKALLTHIHIRYQRGNKATKKSLLEDFGERFNYHRKAAIRLLSQIEPDRPGPGPKRRYRPEELLEHLQTIWLATDQIGSKK